jgi:hypothetical protein
MSRVEVRLVLFSKKRIEVKLVETYRCIKLFLLYFSIDGKVPKDQGKTNASARSLKNKQIIAK